MSNLIKMLAAAITVFLWLPLYAQDQTKIGFTATACTAPNVIGTTSCSPAKPLEKKAEQKRSPAPAAASSRESAEVRKLIQDDAIVGGVKESEVTEYIANYGKPSREAVRAILNPTDDNINALLRQEQSQLAVAAYTAQRRVAIMEAQGVTKAPVLSQSDLPQLIGMRIVVFVTPDCRGCDRILPIVNQVVTEFPSIDARIGVVGQFDAKDFVLRTSAFGVYLPVSSISRERLERFHLEAVPAILVGDARFQSEDLISAEFANAFDLEQALVSVRKRNEKRTAPDQNNVKGRSK